MLAISKCVSACCIAVHDQGLSLVDLRYWLEPDGLAVLARVRDEEVGHLRGPNPIRSRSNPRPWQMVQCIRPSDVITMTVPTR